MGKGNTKYLRDVKVIPGELQHRLVVVDLVKKVVRKEAVGLLQLKIMCLDTAYQHHTGEQALQ